MIRTALLSVALLALCLALLKGLVLLLEPRLAFYPLRGLSVTPRDLGIGYRSLGIETGDGEKLTAWWLPHPDALAEVVYWHGNGGNLSLWLEALAAIRAHRLSVLALDYRGYGTSTGRPSERGLYRDTEATVRAFRETLHVPGAPVVYWGRSLGAAMAAHATTVSAPDGLILEGAFPDVGSLLRSDPLMAFLSFFSSYRFPTAELLRGYRGQTLVMHAELDEVVPLELGRALFELLSPPKLWVTIPDAGHNDLQPAARAEYWGPVMELVQALRPSDAAPARGASRGCARAEKRPGAAAPPPSRG